MQITSTFRRLTFANVTSSLALFIALGGASYAAIKVSSTRATMPSTASRRSATPAP
jgi:hypothetical protein